jgi:hypothetical protein
MSWRNELTVGIMRAERIFYGTSNGGLGSELSTTELGWLDDITPGTAEASKCLVFDANIDIAGINDLSLDGDLVATAGGITATLGAITASAGNVVITAGNLVMGSTTVTEAEIAALDGLTPGTATASKLVQLDANKDFGGIRNLDLGVDGSEAGR